MEGVLPRLCIGPEFLSEAQDIAPEQLFGRVYDDYVLEIGFGQGEHVSAMMRERPETGFIAAEPFINGVAAFLKDIQGMNEPNVRVLNDDGMKIACSLRPSSISKIYILNPDPWPKTRHHERRIINPENLDVLAKILKPGGELVLSTDVPGLADWMVTHTFNHPQFEWTANEARDFWTRPSGWHPTRYELKGANHSKRMCYLLFRRR